MRGRRKPKRRKPRTESKDRLAIMSKITLMGGLHVRLDRKFKVPFRDCEYSDTRYRSDLANESSQREITIKCWMNFGLTGAT